MGEARQVLVRMLLECFSTVYAVITFGAVPDHQLVVTQQQQLHLILLKRNQSKQQQQQSWLVMIWMPCYS